MGRSTLSRRGTPHREITEATRELTADLIIIATNGYTRLAHILLGSTTERVVHHTPCPVLVVREKERKFLRS
jgi:nucleotide-binding universal stress UspA family protein